MLRVHQLDLARRQAEQAGVELVDVAQRPLGLDVVGVRHQLGRDAGRQELLVGEEPDRLAPLAQVLPELVDVLGAREAARQADDGDLHLAAVLPVGAAARLGRHGGRPPRHRRRRREGRREGADRGVLEQLDERDLAAERLLQPGVHAGEQQRVAAEVEEVVVDAHLLDRQRLLPDRGDDALQLALGRRVGRLQLRPDPLRRR